MTDHPEDTVFCINKHHLVAFFDEVEFLFGEEIAHFLSATHAKRDEPIAILPRAEGDWLMDIRPIEIGEIFAGF